MATQNDFSIERLTSDIIVAVVDASFHEVRGAIDIHETDAAAEALHLMALVMNSQEIQSLIRAHMLLFEKRDESEERFLSMASVWLDGVRTGWLGRGMVEDSEKLERMMGNND